MSTEKARENRLRRAARRYGLVLERNRVRDPNAPGYGTYALIRAIGSRSRSRLMLVAGDPATGYGMTLDDVEAYLNGLTG